METMTTSRRAQLHSIVRAYVEEGLIKGNLDAIPYHDEVEVRAPLCPGGSAVPLRGKKNFLEMLTKVLEAVEQVELVNSFVNEELTAATVEFHCSFKEPKVKLRVMDRFRVNKEGYITEQENFYDPRDITHPGWQQS